MLAEIKISADGGEWHLSCDLDGTDLNKEVPGIMRFPSGYNLSIRAFDVIGAPKTPAPMGYASGPKINDLSPDQMTKADDRPVKLTPDEIAAVNRAKRAHRLRALFGTLRVLGGGFLVRQEPMVVTLQHADLGVLLEIAGRSALSSHQGGADALR